MNTVPILKQRHLIREPNVETVFGKLLSNDWDLNFLLKIFAYRNDLAIIRASITRFGFA
jgi:hypothetical protein